jgi:Fur family zinc uptake transcriptional regulator
MPQSVIKKLATAEHFCKKNNLRLTDKRKAVLQTLMQTNEALSAYELIEAYRNDHQQTLSAMSVYRILEFLESAKLIHKLDLTNKYLVCAHLTCSHPHEYSQFLSCNQCGQVQEINVPNEIFIQLKQSAENYGFFIKSPHLELTGLCHSCQK